MDIKKFCFYTGALLLICSSAYNACAQTWNPNFSIGTTTNKYSFSNSQVPDPLTEVFSAMLPVDAGCTYLWQQSTSPVFSSYSNAAGTNTAATYTFTAAVTQTTYYRLMVTNTGVSVYSNILKISVVSTKWEDMNYTRDHEVISAGVSPTFSTVDQLPIGQKLQNTSYVDGLERPVQTISASAATPAKGSNTWGDVVTFNQYDAYGREPLKYISYTTTTNAGKYKATAVTDQQQYYSANYGETSPYTSITFDNSPMDREITMKQPGASWASNAGDSIIYDVNTLAENVQIFSADSIRGDAPLNYGTYPAGTLFKIVLTDENGNKTITYKNKAGQSILTKKQAVASPSVAHNGWLCTYNVYDDLGVLRFVLQPGAVSYLDANSWSFAGTNGQGILQEMCNQYFYDDKGRLIWAKEAGMQAFQGLYDAKDRLIFKQDGNQAALSTPQWTANIYDALDRATMEVLYNTTESVANLQNDITANPNSPISSANLSNGAVCTIVKYLYYDDYTYTGAKAFSTNFDNNSAYNPTGNPNVIPIAASQRTIGFVTGSVTRVLGTSTFLTSTAYYDEKGRNIQILEDNILQGQDITTMQFHWDGRLLSVSRKHTTSGSGYSTFPVLTINRYDQIGRLTSISKQVGSNAVKTIATYAYDDLGRTSVRTLDSGYAGAGKTNMETLAYTFNIHNQLTGINKGYALKDTTYNKWQNFFGEYLGYDNKDGNFAAKQLDGDITGQIWCTQGDDAQRKYDYAYDAARRMINANYNEQQQPGNGWSHTTMDFSVTGSSGQLTYDLNGNLLSMVQKGVLPGVAAPVQIDNLSYTYQSNSNKLSYITDNGSAGSANGQSGDFKDGTNAAGTPDYAYDANGNLIVDLNKGVGTISGGVATAGITYNFLNKPVQVTIPGKGTVTNVYDANGRKLQKVFAPLSGATTTTTYAGEFIYQTSSATPTVNTLQYINFEEGRIRIISPVSQSNGYDALVINGALTMPNSKQGVYDFFIKDYEENVSMVLTEEVHTGSNQCTMETSRASAEDPIFQGSGNEVENTRVLTSSIPGSAWHANTSTYVSQLGDYTGAFKMGPNVLLKVMAGDTINATTQYYYQSSGSYPAGTAGLTQGVLASLINSITGSNQATSLAKAGSSNIQTALSGSTPFGFITDPGTNGSASTSAPQAFLTVVFFDERFNYLSGGSQWIQVSQAGDAASPLVLANIQAPKNGYAYVYVSNKASQPVFFDNFRVGLNHARLMEEDHYYSYGLKIASLSSVLITDSLEGHLANYNQYQAAFSEFDADLGWSDFALRNYDPQTGKWLQHDPYDQHSSAYTGMGDNPANNIDIDGGISGGAIGSLIGVAAGFATPYIIQAITGKHIKHKGLWGLGGAFLGSGIGFGIGGTLVDGGGLFNNIAAFYDGLLGLNIGTVNGNTAVSAFSIDFGCKGFNYADIPDIWGWVGQIPIRPIGIAISMHLSLFEHTTEQFDLNIKFKVNQPVINNGDGSQSGQNNKGEMDQQIDEIIAKLKQNKDATLLLTGGVRLPGKATLDDAGYDSENKKGFIFRELAADRVQTVMNEIASHPGGRQVIDQVMNSGKINTDRVAVMGELDLNKVKIKVRFNFKIKITWGNP